MRKATTALITHPACLSHETPPGHPERVDRLRAVLAALDDAGFSGLDRRDAPLADIEAIARVHDRGMIEAVLAAIPTEESGVSFVQLDGDTYASPGSREAALRAAGALQLGVDLVVAGDVENAFCAVRPPGHHAERDATMGFCLFNNIAIGALHARSRHGLKRIAVVDFDVHHGNGTQHNFEEDRNLFFLSTHQMPLYPGTGAASERGKFRNVVNLPLPPGAGSQEFRLAMAKTGFPALEDFAPDLILVSAGFDAHKRDPLAGLTFETSDFAWVTRELKALAAGSAKGRIVSTLEGGYDLQALADSAAAHVAALMA
ncbi:MAG: histone deacetylase family protein [Alphaproteobacteria bacterium]